MNLHFVKQTFEKEFPYVITNIDTSEIVFCHHLRNVIPKELLKHKIASIMLANDGIVHLSIFSEQEPDSKVLVEDLIDIIVDDNYKLAWDKKDKLEYVTGITIGNGTFNIFFR